MAAKVFFSYSHADEALRDQLERQLDILRRQGVVETWHDRRIGAGQDFGDEIDHHLEEADVILLLVSSDFLSSDYCQDIELQRALERNAEGTAIVIPVILRDCLWQRAAFGKLQATPTNGRAVTQWPDRDQALAEVARAIEAAALRFGGPQQSSNWRGMPRPMGHEERTAKAVGHSGPRSSNLRLAKTFTDRDRDRFLRDAFEFMARFFENSLVELSARNKNIEGDFRRIDANRFTTGVYDDGKAIAKCSIFIGSSLGNGIGFAHGEGDGGGTSYNENLTVEADDQCLFLRPMGFGTGGERDSKLSEEGAAELYWSMLISRLQ